jgi:hypothetical protein
MRQETYRIVTPRFWTALDAARAAIALRDDDDGSRREFVDVTRVSSAGDDMYERISTRLQVRREMLSREIT